MMRQRSKSDGLMSKTLEFVRSYSYSDLDLDRTERFLEREIRRESCIPPRDKPVARLRLKGEHVLRSKHVLLFVVILNLVDCALVLGELILDIHYIKELRDERDAFSQHFVDTMKSKYPKHIRRHHVDNIRQLYEEFYIAECHWPNDAHALNDFKEKDGFEFGFQNKTVNRFDESNHHTMKGSHDDSTQEYHGFYDVTMHETHKDHINTTRSRRNVQTAIMDQQQGPGYTMEFGNNLSGNSGANYSSDHGNGYHDDHQRSHSVWENIAHGMHKASITILGILFVENLAKVVCMGKDFFMMKLEVFDAVVVIISFVVDLLLLKGLMEYKIQDVVFILTFLLPWRVIRVVNSLIVAVLDHEHFRLKKLYQEKKKIAAELKVLKKQEKGWDFHLQKIEKFCESEGIPKWRIRQHTAMGRKQSTITTMAALAVNSFLKGMLIMSSSDQEELDRSLILSNQTSPPTDDTTHSVHYITETYSIDDEIDSAGRNHRHHATEGELRNGSSPLKEKEMLANVEPADRLRVDVGDREHHPDQGILKNVSRASRNVTFQPKEHKPLLHGHISFNSNDETKK